MEPGIQQTEMEIDIDQVVQEQIAVMRGSVRELTRTVLSTALNERYQKRVAGLERESESLANELQMIEKGYQELKPRLEARHRVLEHQIDECLAAGDDRTAAAKRAEMEEEGKRLSQLGEKIEAHTARLHAIGRERKQIGREVFAEAYRLFPLASFAVIAAMVELLDALRAGMFEFAQATGTQEDSRSPLIRRYHIEGLTPSTMPGSDRRLFGRVKEWFP